MELSNSLAKQVRSLLIPKIRNEKQLFIVEGTKCVTELLAADYETKFIVIDKSNEGAVTNIIKTADKNNIIIYEANGGIFNNLCDAVSSQAVVAIAKMKPNAKIKNNASFVALDNVADPGNVGTIIRTADWFGIPQVVLIGNCANVYNPKVVRSAMGSTFHLRIVSIENSTDFSRIFCKNIPIYAAVLNANECIDEIKQDNKNKNEFGLIVGNEARGVSPFLNNVISQKFLIRGFGNAESLNVATATGIALYELTK